MFRNANSRRRPNKPWKNARYYSAMKYSLIQEMKAQYCTLNLLQGLLNSKELWWTCKLCGTYINRNVFRTYMFECYFVKFLLPSRFIYVVISLSLFSMMKNIISQFQLYFPSNNRNSPRSAGPFFFIMPLWFCDLTCTIVMRHTTTNIYREREWVCVWEREREIKNSRSGITSVAFRIIFKQHILQGGYTKKTYSYETQPA